MVKKQPMPGNIDPALIAAFRARGNEAMYAQAQRARRASEVPRVSAQVHALARGQDKQHAKNRMEDLLGTKHKREGGIGGWLHDVPVVGRISNTLDNDVFDPLLHGAKIAAHTPAAITNEAALGAMGLTDTVGLTDYKGDERKKIADLKRGFASVQAARDQYQVRHDAGDPEINDKFMESMNHNVKQALDKLHKEQTYDDSEHVGWDWNRYHENVLNKPRGLGSYLHEANPDQKGWLKAANYVGAIAFDLTTDVTLKIKAGEALAGGREMVMGRVLADHASNVERVVEGAARGDKLAVKLLGLADQAGGGKAALDAVVKNHAVLLATKVGQKGGTALTRSESKLFLGTTGGAKLAGHTLIPMEATHLITKPLSGLTKGLRDAGTLGKVADEFSGKYGTTLRRGMRSGDVTRAVDDYYAKQVIDLTENVSKQRSGTAERALATIARHVKRSNHQAITDAIESLDEEAVARLPERARELVQHIKDTTGAFETLQEQAGMQVGHVDGYMPRYVSERAKKALGSDPFESAKSGGERVVGLDKTRLVPGDAFLDQVLPAFNTPLEGRQAMQQIFNEHIGRTDIPLFEDNLYEVLPRYYKDAASAIRVAEVDQALRGMQIIEGPNGGVRAVDDLTKVVDDIGNKLHPPDEPPPGGGVGGEPGPEGPTPPRGGFRPRRETGQYMQIRVDDARTVAADAEENLQHLPNASTSESQVAVTRANVARAETMNAEAGVSEEVEQTWHRTADLPHTSSAGDVRKAVTEDWKDAHGREPKGTADKAAISKKVRAVKARLKRVGEKQSLQHQIDGIERRVGEAVETGNQNMLDNAVRDSKKVSKLMKRLREKWDGEISASHAPEHDVRGLESDVNDVNFDPQGSRDYEIMNDPNASPSERVAARNRIDAQTPRGGEVPRGEAVRKSGNTAFKDTQVPIPEDEVPDWSLAFLRDGGKDEFHYEVSEITGTTKGGPRRIGKVSIADRRPDLVRSRPGTGAMLDAQTGKPVSMRTEVNADASSLAPKGSYNGPRDATKPYGLGEVEGDPTLGQIADWHYARGIQDLSGEDQNALWVKRFQAELDALFPEEGSKVESAVTRSGATVYRDRTSIIVNWGDFEGAGQEVTAPYKGFEADARASQNAADLTNERARVLGGEGGRTIRGGGGAPNEAQLAVHPNMKRTDYPYGGEGISPEDRQAFLDRKPGKADRRLGGESTSTNVEDPGIYEGATNDAKGQLTRLAEERIKDLPARMQQRVGAAYEVTVTEATIRLPRQALDADGNLINLPDKVFRGKTIIIGAKPWVAARQNAIQVSAAAQEAEDAFQAGLKATGGLRNAPEVTDTEAGANAILEATQGLYNPVRLGRSPTDAELDAEMSRFDDLFPDEEYGGGRGLPRSMFMHIMGQEPEGVAAGAADATEGGLKVVKGTTDDAAANFKQMLGDQMGPEPTDEELDLLERAMSGDKEAFDQLSPEVQQTIPDEGLIEPPTGKGAGVSGHGDEKLVRLMKAIKKNTVKAEEPLSQGFAKADEATAQIGEDYLDSIIHLAQQMKNPRAEAAAEGLMDAYLQGQNVATDTEILRQLMHADVDPTDLHFAEGRTMDAQYIDMAERYGKDAPRVTLEEDSEFQKIFQREVEADKAAKAARGADAPTVTRDEVADAVNQATAKVAAPPAPPDGPTWQEVLQTVRRTRPQLGRYLDDFETWAADHPDLHDAATRAQIISDTSAPEDLARDALAGEEASAYVEHAMNVRYGTEWRHSFPSVSAIISDEPRFTYVQAPRGLVDVADAAPKNVAPHIAPLDAQDSQTALAGREDIGWLEDQMRHHSEAGNADVAMSYRVAAAEPDPARRLVATMEANAEAASLDATNDLGALGKGLAARGPARQQMVDGLQAAMGRSMKQLFHDPKSMAPDDIADALKIMTRGYEKNGIEVFLDKHLAPLVNWMKVWQTSSPGFHVRNAIGNVFNNWLAGVDPEAYSMFFKLHNANIAGEGSAKWAKLTVQEQSWARDLAKLDLHGPFSQQFLTTDTIGSKFSRVNPLSKHGVIARGSTKLGGMADALGRGPLAVDTLMKGGTLDEAVGAINKFHFNYSDLSRTEQNLKRFIPFYTFTRHNLPLQIEYALTNTKVIGSYLTLKRNSDIFAKQDGVHQPWLTEGIAGGFAIPFGYGGGNLYGSNRTPLGEASDILHDPKSGLTGMLTPLVKIPLEQYSGTRMYKNFEVSDHGVDLPAYMSWIPHLGDGLGALGAAERDKKTGHWQVRADVLDDLENVVPLMGRARRLIPGGDEARQRAWMNAVISFALGGMVKTNTKAQQRHQFEGALEQQAFAKIDAIKRTLSEQPFKRPMTNETRRLLDRKRELGALIDDIKHHKFKVPSHP